MPLTNSQPVGHCAAEIVEFRFEKRFLLEEDEDIFSLFFNHNELLLRKSKMILFSENDLEFIYVNLMLIIKFG